MPKMVSAKKHQDIREAIEAGMKGKDIMALLNTSVGTITNIKREMGLPIRPMNTRTRGPVKAVAQVVPETNITELAQQALEQIRAEAPILLSLRKMDRGTAEVLSDDTGINIKTVKNNLTQLKRAGLAYEVGKDGHATVYAPLSSPPEPTAPLRPEAYVTAFENRVLEYHTLLRQYEHDLLERDGTIERLKKEFAKLRDEYAQTVFRQQNWQGPKSIMNQSLGNGG